MKIKKSSIVNFSTVIILLLPLFDEYSIAGISGSVSDYLLFILLPIACFFVGYKNRKRSYYEAFLIATGYCTISMLVMMINTGFNTGILIDYLRLVAMLIITGIFLPKLTNVQMCKEVATGFGVFHSIYTLLQYVAIKIVGVYLPSYLPFFQHREDLKNEINYLNYSYYYRPHSIFSEPSHLALYLLPIFCVCLTEEQKTKKSFINLLIIAMAMLLSGSTTAILGLAIIIVLYGISKLKKMKRKIHPVRLAIVLVSVIGAIVIAVKSSTFQIFVQRFFVDRSTVTLRTENLGNMFGKGIIQILFGRGYLQQYVANKVGWLPSYGLIIAYFGIVGLIMFIIAFILVCMKIFRNSNLQSRICFLLFLILCFFTEVSFTCFFIYFIIFTVDNRNLNNVKSRPSKHYHTSI